MKTMAPASPGAISLWSRSFPAAIHILITTILSLNPKSLVKTKLFGFEICLSEEIIIYLHFEFNTSR